MGRRIRFRAVARVGLEVVGAATYLCPPAPERPPRPARRTAVHRQPAPRCVRLPARRSALERIVARGLFREHLDLGGRAHPDDGSSLFFSLQALADPDGAQVGADAVYLGFSKDGTTAVVVKVLMTAAPPRRVSPTMPPRSRRRAGGRRRMGDLDGVAQTGSAADLGHLVDRSRLDGAGTGNGAAWASTPSSVSRISGPRSASPAR